MSTLVESLKRLYSHHKISKEKLIKLVEKGTIITDEYKYITGEGYENV